MIPTAVRIPPKNGVLISDPILFGNHELGGSFYSPIFCADGYGIAMSWDLFRMALESEDQGYSLGKL